MRDCCFPSESEFQLWGSKNQFIFIFIFIFWNLRMKNKLKIWDLKQNNWLVKFLDTLKINYLLKWVRLNFGNHLRLNL